MTDEDKEACMLLKDKYNWFGRIIMKFTTYVRILDTDKIPSLPLIDKIKEHEEIMQHIPDEILREIGYKEFL